MSDIIDKEGFRAGVGIILSNSQKKVLWAKRIHQNSWQFPQGGIEKNESPEEAMFRELFEEIGLMSENVTILGCTKEWLSYTLPKNLIRKDKNPECIGQKQKWFLLKLCVDDSNITLDHSKHPEFNHWRWVDYLFPVDHIISFKHSVYQQALNELKIYL